ncbi:MAG: proton-conducting transporter membrane subunit [Chloroflexota bacterium]|nr:proton-conducting transporter membrane subunit [Chloroflexota bacterium]
MAAWLILLSLLIPWLGALIVWLVGDDHPAIQHRFASGISIIGGAVSLLLLLIVDDSVAVSIHVGGSFGYFTLVADGLGVYLAIIAAVIGSLTVIFSNDYMKGEAQLGRFYSLTLLFIGAMIGLVLSGSLLFMFIFWEITAFCSYALISFHNDDPKAVYGGIKALIMTQIGGIGLLAGAIIAYVYLGSYQINDFLARADTFPSGIFTLLAFGFLIAAAAKSAQVPFHTWLPDAMEAPTPTSALIHAATMVNAGVYLLARFQPAFAPISGWGPAVMTVGLVSALMAAILAVTTFDLKRALAYSTISQLGYMFYAIGVGAIFASQFHLFSHSVFKALLFLCAGAVIHAVGTRDMRQMGGLGRLMPFVMAVFFIGTLALAGLPITNGFFSKELILEAGLAHGPLWAYLGVLVGAGITGLYSIRMLSLVFFIKKQGSEKAHHAPSAMRVSLFVLAFGTLTTWLLLGPFSQMLANTLPYHYLSSANTPSIITEIITTPMTWVALLVILFGMVLWQMRARLSGVYKALRPLVSITRQDFGFEWLNQKIIQVTTKFASALRTTQTGQLNWNVLGIVTGLVLLLALLAWMG